MTNELDQLIYLNLERADVGQLGVTGDGTLIVNRAPATDAEAVDMLRRLARAWGVDWKKILDAEPNNDESDRDYDLELVATVPADTIILRHKLADPDKEGDR